jgi:putative transposase
LLNETLFTTLAQARVVLAEWRNDYNEERPHGSIGNVPPAALMTAGSTISPISERYRKL